MEVKNNVDDIIKSAYGAMGEGNYKEAIAMVEPLLKKEKKKTLSPVQEMRVRDVLAQGYRLLDDGKSALPHSMRELELTIQLYGKGSKEHALALDGLGMVERNLKNLKSAKKRFNDAAAIYTELGMEKSVEYGSLLVNLAKVDLRWKEALDGYVKAKAVMDNFKEHPNYGVIVNDMAICYENLNQWTEALQCYREAVELRRNTVGDQHPQYATSINNLAFAYVSIKQPTIAIPLYEDSLAIHKRVFGDKHPNTIMVINYLATARELESHEVANPADVRMCNNCEKVDKSIRKECRCTKVNYCNEECQLAHWEVHRPDCQCCYLCDEFCESGVMVYCPTCHVFKYCGDTCLEKDKNDHPCVPRCYQCRKDGLKLDKCSACKTATYCSVECQKKHWPIHKGECKKK